MPLLQDWAGFVRNEPGFRNGDGCAAKLSPLTMRSSQAALDCWHHAVRDTVMAFPFLWFLLCFCHCSFPGWDVPAGKVLPTCPGAARSPILPCSHSGPFVLSACERAQTVSCPQERDRVPGWMLSRQKFPGFSCSPCWLCGMSCSCLCRPLAHCVLTAGDLP